MSTSRKSDSSALAILAGSLIILIYALVFLLEPLSDLANQLILGSLTLAASALVSIYATLIFRLLLPSDAPRVVWMNFAIGFWFWTLAELLWLLRGLSLGNVGGTASRLTLAHLFWFAAYIFFSIALYRQHRIIATPRHAHGVWVVFAIWGGVIAAALLMMWAMDGSFEFLVFLQYFFGFADLAVGIVGLSILITFRGGALAWPWWGFLGLAVSNVIYAALDASMMTTASATTILALELLSELIYLGAYLVLVFGFYKHYQLLRYGPAVGEPTAQPPTRQKP